jgi:signal transduction histidine kinase
VTSLSALQRPAVTRFRGVRSLVTAGLVVAFTLVLVAGLSEPMSWRLIAIPASALLFAALIERSRASTVRDEELEAELRDTIQELRRSRARVVHVADNERRRIERDLHDGAQQRLIALRIKLTLAEELVGGDNPPVGDLIQEIAAEAETALEDLHALVHGIYPPLLADRGLGDALNAMGRAAPVPTRVLAGNVGRHDSDVETAVYFVCAEALQNTAKHAGPGATARVAVRNESGGLAFEVRDDGRGFDTSARSGSGLANMQDRLGAVGGRLNVVSAPQCGAIVQGWVPEPAPER